MQNFIQTIVHFLSIFYQYVYDAQQYKWNVQIKHVINNHGCVEIVVSSSAFYLLSSTMTKNIRSSECLHHYVGVRNF